MIGFHYLLLQLFVFIPFDSIGLFGQDEFPSVAFLGIKRGKGVRAVGMLDAIYADEEHVFQVFGGVDPGMVDNRTVGKTVRSLSGVCRPEDVGVVEVEIALKTVAVGIGHYAIAHRAFQFLRDDAACLPSAFVFDATGFSNHGNCFLWFAVGKINQLF